MEFYQIGIITIVLFFAGTFLYVWVTTPKEPINKSVIKTIPVSGNVKHGLKNPLSSKRKHRRY